MEEGGGRGREGQQCLEAGEGEGEGEGEERMLTLLVVNLVRTSQPAAVAVVPAVVVIATEPCNFVNSQEKLSSSI